MSREANEIARKLIQDWLAYATRLGAKDPGRVVLDDLQGRIADALDRFWQQGMDDARLETLLKVVRSNPIPSSQG